MDKAWRMASKVEGSCGKVVYDGKGRGVWCEACCILQPLSGPFEVQNWNTHVGRKKHQDKVCAHLLNL